MVLASKALTDTLVLIAVFGGMGVLVGGLVAYAIAQALGERKENEEYRESR